MIRRQAAGAVAALVGALTAVGQAHGQSVVSSLSALAEENARLYVSPISIGLASSLNSGFQQTAKAHEQFGFDIGLRVMAALPPAEADFFQPVLPGSVVFDGDTYTNPYEVVGDAVSPTAVGEGTGAVLQPTPGGTFYDALVDAGEDPADYQVPFPDGADIPAVPFLVLQGSLGLGYGTDVTVRYLPRYEVHEDVGEIAAFGYGLKHSLTQWLPSEPGFDVAVTAGWQDFSIGEYLDASASSFGVIASVSPGPVTVYSTVRREQATVDVSYVVENLDDNLGLPVDGVEIAFTEDLPAEVYFSAGLTVNLAGFELSGEYAFAEYNTVAARIGFSMN